MDRTSADGSIRFGGYPLDQQEINALGFEELGHVAGGVTSLEGFAGFVYALSLNIQRDEQVCSARSLRQFLLAMLGRLESGAWQGCEQPNDWTSLAQLFHECTRQAVGASRSPGPSA